MDANLPENHDHQTASNKIRYFMPNQVILHLEHPRGLEPAVLLGMLNAFLTERSKEDPWSYLGDLPGTERLMTFDREERKESFSIVPVPSRQPVEEPDAAYQGTAEAILEFYDQIPRGGNGFDLRDGVWLASVAPNWLLGAASHQIGLGGPGSWPELAGLLASTEPAFDFAEKELLEAKQGEDVHVAILDSLPCLHALAEAYEYWHSHLPGAHPLLERLLGAGSPLHLYPASFDDLRSLSDYSAAGHCYPMADHGTFIAGIIHTIARQAILHLYEVLNPYGIGSIETIAGGLLRALSDAGTRPLVINCSFMLGAAGEGGFDPGLTVFQANLFSNLTMTARELFEGIERKNVLVVAAAGNDGAGGNSPPPARYPAAYSKVIGVGALAKPRLVTAIRELASYSNQADRSPQVGYYTLGGEKRDGIGGVYIGGIPVNNSGLPDRDPGILPEDIDYVPNLRRGWAEWSGTSFAAPIISGLLARWWSAHTGDGPAQARSFLDSIATAPAAGAISPFTGTEKIIAVDQA